MVKPSTALSSSAAMSSGCMSCSVSNWSRARGRVGAAPRAGWLGRAGSARRLPADVLVRPAAEQPPAVDRAEHILVAGDDLDRPARVALGDVDHVGGRAGLLVVPV